MATPAVHHGAMFDTNELVLNMGPQHPSTHGVLRVVLRLDGEKVVDADVVIGYLHRGIEKLSENRNWTQIILLTDRMDYVAAATSNVGYCETAAPSSASCSASPATACGSAPTRWTSGR
jgi:NADH:ubiquinone oxidoreductase subunit D